MNNFFLLILIIFFSSCSTRFAHSHKIHNYSKTSNLSLYKSQSAKHNVNYKTVHAICFTESSESPYVIHVNEGKYSGPHRFKTSRSALNYINRKLQYSNYDTGICQINSWWLNRLNITPSHLLDKKYNIGLAAKIYSDNLKRCKNEIYCALSIYNTGKKKSSIGKKYAHKVLKNRRYLYKNNSY